MHYRGEIEIWPFPAVLDDELAEGLEEGGIDADSVRRLLAGEGSADENGLLWIAIGSEGCSLRRDEQRGLVLGAFSDDASFGCDQYYNSALTAALKRAGLAFVASDEHERFSWHPGLAEDRHTSLSEGEVALSNEEFEGIKQRTTTTRGLIDPVALAEIVVAHFEDDPYDWWPGKPDPAGLFEPVVLKAEPRERPSALAG